MRKIIQIAVSPATNQYGVYLSPDLFALCDDSTVWWNKGEGEWRLITPIPQEPVEATPVPLLETD